jgi:hypothetical protein
MEIELNLETINVNGSNHSGLTETFDMAILDESRITEKFNRQLEEVKKGQEPIFTPVLALITANGSYPTSMLR